MHLFMGKKTRYVGIKTDMHLHSNDDPCDSWHIGYSSFGLVDALEARGFGAFSLTLHDFMLEDASMRELEAYAKDKGIISVPGIEKTIEGNHVLIHNMRKEDAEGIATYEALEKARSEYASAGRKTLVVAPHPFYPSAIAVGSRFVELSHLFDGLEYNSFYSNGTNWFNRKAVKEAVKHRKAMLGNTDGHDLSQLGRTYSRVYMPVFAFGTDPGAHLSPEAAREYVRSCTSGEYAGLQDELIVQAKQGHLRLSTRGFSLLECARLFWILFVSKHLPFRKPSRSCLEAEDRVAL